MANKIEYSRLVFKRSGVTGVEPTVPTGDTIDNTWLDTDLLVGEGFINIADDKFWFRTDNGIVEVAMSGVSSDNYYTDYVYLSGNTLIFDRNDTLDAYSIDLSSLTGLTGGDYLPLSGGSLTGGLSGTSLNLSSIGSGTPRINLGLDIFGNVVTGTTSSSIVTVTGNTSMGELSATTVSILNSGATSRDYFDYSGNLVETGVTNSAIVAGSGNTISSGLRNVFVSGVDLTASANDTAYFNNVNVAGNLVGTPCDFSFAISDETTQITTGNTKLTFYAPYAMTIRNVYASLSSSGSTGSEFDIENNGASIFSTKLTIDANEFHSSDASTQPTVSSPSVAEFDKLTVDILSAGTGSAGAKIYITGLRV
jgi:hypothetical protein